MWGLEGARYIVCPWKRKSVCVQKIVWYLTQVDGIQIAQIVSREANDTITMKASNPFAEVIVFCVSCSTVSLDT